MPSKLEQLQLQFRQRLMQEKEERMIKIHTDSQQKALNKVSRYDSNYQVPVSVPVPKKSAGVLINQPHQSPVKKGSPGVDRSRPLPPISKEQKNSYNNRISPASTPGEYTGKIIIPNGVRPKSVDSDTKHISNKAHSQARMKHRTGTDLFHSLDMELHRNMYLDFENKPPSMDNLSKLKQAELQRVRMNGKVNGDNAPKPTNGHFAATGNNSKSSNDRRASPVGNRPPHPVSSVPKGKQMSQASTFVRRSPATSVKTGPGAAAARKAPSASQEQCRHCGRNFNRDRIEKHVTICFKTSQKRRKVFDVTKMRVQGTEAETYVKKGAPATQTPKPKKTNWKKQHEEFIATIRQAKVMQRHLAAGGKVSDLPPPPPSDTSHYIPCPHCGRKFSEGPAERHIPKCKSITSNKKQPPKRK